MISVAAIRMQQFGVQFYQASLSASDIDKLVRFEVLSYGEQSQPVRGRKKAPVPSKVNWDLLERRIAANEKAYQRQIIRKKIDELVQYLSFKVHLLVSRGEAEERLARRLCAGCSTTVGASTS